MTKQTLLDDDFDGRFETLLKYRHGNVYFLEFDQDGDERPDYIERFESSVPTEAEFLVGAGVVAKKKLFEAGVLKKAFLDEDLDGNFDVVVRYDNLEEEVERVPYR